VEEADAQIGFERRDIAADGGWRDGKTAGCRRKASQLGTADKGLEIGESFHLWIFNVCLKLSKIIPAKLPKQGPEF
jgi:hypothetical protein